jgi:phosphatidylglycerophosphate synthase
MVPVFAALAVLYGNSVKAGYPNETLRWWALGVFVVAAASDGIDGWVARHFNQISKFGAFIDPIADKGLLLTGVIVLSLVDGGTGGWGFPLWFAGLVMFALGWVMLKVVDISPIYPCIVAAIFTVWSGIAYVQQGWKILQGHDV